MCDFHSFQKPHVCEKDTECERAYRMIVYGQFYGQECLLRGLERYGECLICRQERLDEEHEGEDGSESDDEGSVELFDSEREHDSDGKVSRATRRRE
jgi:hypothetical protein